MIISTTHKIINDREPKEKSIYLDVRSDGKLYPVIIKDVETEEDNPTASTIYLTKSMAIELAGIIIESLGEVKK
jgi:orotate phosphoribosyltransferase-like protein